MIPSERRTLNALCTWSELIICGMAATVVVVVAVTLLLPVLMLDKLADSVLSFLAPPYRKGERINPYL